MSNVKPFLLGKHLTAITVRPLAIDADGNVTYATTASSLSGYIDFVRIGGRTRLEDITSVDATDVNYVKSLNDSMLALGEILRRKTTSPAGAPVLASMYVGYDAVEVTFTRGGQTWTYRGIIETYDDGVTSFGKNTAELTLKPLKETTGSPITFTP